VDANAHPGDAEATVLYLRKNATTNAWEPTLVGVGRDEHDRFVFAKFNFLYHPDLKPWLFNAWPHFRMTAWLEPRIEGTGLTYHAFHPIVYYSASKQHAYLDAFGDVDDSPYSKWGCCDDVNGAGPARLAEIWGCRFNGSPLPYGNNVGEWTPQYHKGDTHSCRSDIERDLGFSQRWCVERHPPKTFVNLLDECAQDGKGEWWFRHENAWELAMSFVGGHLPTIHSFDVMIPCSNANSEACWDAMRGFLLDPSNAVPPGDPPSEYVLCRNFFAGDPSSLRNKWYPRLTTDENDPHCCER